MEYIYAALLLHGAGKEITEEAITAVMEAAGIEVDKGRVKALVAALNGVNIEEAIAQASSMPMAVPAAQPQVTAEAPTPTPEAPAKEEKKEKKEEK
ncbi:MAG: 50S ribosomal protein P1, partial [Candidatus Methanospirareceae archaeon]